MISIRPARGRSRRPAAGKSSRIHSSSSAPPRWTRSSWRAPDALHAQFALACLDIGKPLLCEKPLAADIADALKIVRAEAKLGKRLISVGFNRRFDPAHVDVKKACSSGEIGAPLYWKGAHRNPSAMYNTSGPFILTNSAGHDIDSARWLLDSDVAEVFVKGLRSRPELPEDARDLLVVQMTMANGLLATAEVFVNADYGYEVIAEVVCSKGTVTTFPTSPADTTIIRSKNRRGTPVTSDFRAYFTESYALEMADWVASILEGRRFSGASAWDGYAAVAVSTAAGKSLIEGRAVSPETIERPQFYR